MPVKFGTPLVLSRSIDDFKAGDFVILLDIVDDKLKVFSTTLHRDKIISLCQEKKDKKPCCFFPVHLAFAATSHSLQGGDADCVSVAVEK